MPVTVAELTVTGALPVEVKVMACVVGVFTTILPKAMLVAFTLSVGMAAFNCTAKVAETLPALAVSVAVCAVLTEETVAEKLTVVAPAGTVTEEGVVTAELLLARFTTKPPLAAAVVSVTVHESVPEPVIELLLHESELSAAGRDVPVPLRAITVEAPVEELLANVS